MIQVNLQEDEIAMIIEALNDAADVMHDNANVRGGAERIEMHETADRMDALAKRFLEAHLGV